MTGSAYGKVILFGEHAVLYGQPALAGGLKEGITVEVTAAAHDHVHIPAWALDAADGPVIEAIRAVRAEVGHADPIRVIGDARIPSRAGFGSSAALLVAVARALGADPIAAQAGERVFHGRPSGLDVAAVSRGGFGLFDMERGWTPVEAPPIRLAVGLSGVSRNTRACVEHVAALPDALRAEIMPRLGDIARRALRDPAKLGALFGEAQALLARLGLSSPRLDELCHLAGGHAKLTGAGRGGAVIAAGDVDAIVARWRAAGFEAFAVEVGAR